MFFILAFHWVVVAVFLAVLDCGFVVSEGLSNLQGLFSMQRKYPFDSTILAFHWVVVAVFLAALGCGWHASSWSDGGLFFFTYFKRTC